MLMLRSLEQAPRRHLRIYNQRPMSARDHHYYIYIVTNPERNVLYTGVTNNLGIRLMEHYANRGNTKTFAGKYYCYNLIYYEISICQQRHCKRKRNKRLAQAKEA